MKHYIIEKSFLYTDYLYCCVKSVLIMPIFGIEKQVNRFRCQK